MVVLLFLLARGLIIRSRTPGGVTIWVEDGIIGNNTSLLTLNNVWTGTQDFQGAVTFDNSATFNTGLTSLGPNVLGGGDR